MSSSDPASGLPEMEPYFDTNVYCGPYPFRPLPAAEPDGLRALLEEASMEGALVTPFPALFHTRPWSGLGPWIRALEGDGRVRFWAVINPALPGWQDDLEAAAAAPQVAGIRLFPRCHGYRPFEPALGELLERAAGHGLPVCLTARLLDDRLYPRMLRVDPPLDLQETGALLKEFARVRWVLTGFYMAEIRTLSPAVLAHPAALVDIGLSKGFEPWWESLTAMLPAERLVVGTGAPLYYHGGVRLALHRSEIEPRARGLLLTANARRLLERRPATTPADSPAGGSHGAV